MVQGRVGVSIRRFGTNGTLLCASRKKSHATLHFFRKALHSAIFRTCWIDQAVQGSACPRRDHVVGKGQMVLRWLVLASGLSLEDTYGAK